MRFPKLFVALLLLGFACQQPAKNQSSDLLLEGNPSSVGMSASRLERVDQMLQGAVDSGYVKGISGLIARNGKIVYYKSFGVADEQNSRPLKNDDIYRIASQTKAITSVAAMMLFEEGKLLLDDPVEKYLSEFKNMEVLTAFDPSDSSYTATKANKKITIRQLLTHTTGMSYFGFGMNDLRSIYAKKGLPCDFGSDQFDLATFSEIAGTLPLAHQPGEHFTYGINTDILGRVIEVVSGVSLDAFFHERIFQPLGMKDTYFYLPEEKHGRLIPVFANEGGVLKAYHGRDEYGVGLDYPLSQGSFYGGGAGLSSTLKDYAVFLQMMLNGGIYNGKRLLSRRTVDLMTSNQIGDLNMGDNKFGLGFEIVTEKGQQQLGVTAGTFRWGGYYGTTYWADPEEDIIGLCFVNQRKGMPGNLHDRFRVMVYAALDD